MIKCKDYVVDGYKNGKTAVRASLVADNSAEVVAIGTNANTVEGLTDNNIMSFGSTCLTVNGDFGQLDSSGNWVF